MQTTTIPAVWMRGGTSKGLFLDPANLPNNPDIRDKMLLAIMGSPDPYGKQIDGLGGATSSTSKIVLVNPSSRDGCDVDYMFGHVAITSSTIDYSGNCGNLSAAVGVFAIEQGMASPSNTGITSVRVWQSNLSQKMIIHVPTTADGHILSHGHCTIAGITNSGAAIKVEFIKPGDQDGKVLPTGHAREHLMLGSGEKITASLINAGNATVFINAETLGLQGTELPDEINNNTHLLERVEKIRCEASVMMGMADNLTQAAAQPGTPKLAIISKPQDYLTSQGVMLKKQESNLSARIFSMGKLHHAFTGTGAIATAVAAQIPDSLVAEVIERPENKNGIQTILKVGHTAGLMECSATVGKTNNRWIAHSASIIRTARSLMNGHVFIPGHYL